MKKRTSQTAKYSKDLAQNAAPAGETQIPVTSQSRVQQFIPETMKPVQIV